MDSCYSHYPKKGRSGPDQGYAWVVAVACFFVNFILVGIARSVAVMYVALVETYGVSREQATLPFSIRVSLRNLSGPLIGLLGLKYGIRAVTTVGGFVAALGSILCYFAPNVMWITVFWGIIHGIGFGLSTVIHMMIINQYFDKYKASALGLGYSGDCFGTFAFPVIMEYLIATYGVRGTFLILGGIVLNVVPMAMLLRKPPWLEENKKAGNFSRNIVQQSVKDNKTNGQMNPPVGYSNNGFSKSIGDLTPYDGIDVECPKNSYEEQENDQPPVYQDVVKQNRRISDLRQELSSISGSLRSHRKPSEISEIIRDSMSRHDSLPPVFEKETLRTVNNQSEELGDTRSQNDENRTENTEFKGVQYSDSMKKSRTSSFVGQMAQDIVNRMRSASFASQVAQDGFITSLQQDQSDETELESDELSSAVIEQVQSKMFDGVEVDRKTSKSGELILSANDTTSTNSVPSYWSIKIKETKKPSIVKTLIRTNMKPIFILISISMAVYAFLFVGVLTIIIDYAVDQGVSHDNGKFLVIGFSVTDLIGRLSFGQVIDRKLIKMKNYSGVTMLLMGTLVASLPLNKSFNFMMVFMCMYGLVQGGTAIMFPILVNYYMDKNEESVAMGCLNFYGGFLMLSMAPMIGYFRDNTGSYNGVFHILGGLVAVVGLVWQLEPLIMKLQRKQMLKHANYVIVTKL